MPVEARRRTPARARDVPSRRDGASLSVAFLIGIDFGVFLRVEVAEHRRGEGPHPAGVHRARAGAEQHTR
jgi:hypothetical protein